MVKYVVHFSVPTQKRSFRDRIHHFSDVGEQSLKFYELLFIKFDLHFELNNPIIKLLHGVCYWQPIARQAGTRIS